MRARQIGTSGRRSLDFARNTMITNLRVARLLLVFDPLIDREEDLKPGLLGCGEKLSILQPC